MNEDKISAYNTLFEVIKTYLQFSAPFVPFTTENIWIKLNKLINKELDSVHLEYRPISSEKYIDNNLIDDTSVIRKIIK
jgi:isoleucyl-tRNA synthetase